MARYRTTIPSSWSAAETFEYLADFRNAEQWDPGVKSAKAVGGAAPGLGAEYDLTVTGTTLRYRTVEHDEPSRVVFEATSTLLRSYDVIEVVPAPTGCNVRYDATLELNGLLKLADPLLGLVFDRIGAKGAAGLTQALSGKRIP